MEIVPELQLLAQQNAFGAAFLLCYGVTWLVCAVAWSRATPRTAALATLFQGVVAFPAAIGLSLLTGALGQPRPVSEAITELSILIGTSQLLGLPFLIYLVITQRYSLLPVAFASILSMHFVLYSWLYQTPGYIVMSALIAVGAIVVMTSAPDEPERLGPGRVCWVTGGILLLTAATFLILQSFAP